jgi:ABC-type lipoprotein release transport system permease subunit
LTENLLFTSVCGLAGIVVGTLISRFLSNYHQAFRVPLDIDAGPDMNVLAFTAIVTIAAAAVLTFFSAQLAPKHNVDSAIRVDTGTPARSRLRINQVLIAVQVALSVLLAVATLAAFIPARRAAAIDPAAVIRDQ